MEFEAVIGLEVHAQLLTRSKLFCGCSTEFGAPSNANTCPVCLGLPGALPVLNREAVTMSVRAALALGCTARPVSIFARKNYFYPDLPKGYQISQFDRPLGEHGFVRVSSGERTERGQIVNRREKSFRITRLHMEEDAGKSIHEGLPGTETKSFVNLNRSGIPLVEIVSEPDFRSSQEAYDYLTHLRRTLLYLGVCDGNMEEGSLRCDANVSVRPAGSPEFGTKVEIKNLNSFRFLQKALDYEIERQKRVLAEGGRIVQETRLWDEAKGSTFPMRTKEEAHDYRYFPEPDLPPLKLDPAWIEELKKTLPELPHEKAKRFVTEYQLSEDDSLLLTATREHADYFEECARLSGNPRGSANWTMGDLTYALKNSAIEIDSSPVAPAQLASLIRKVDSGEISGKIAKTVFEEMFRTGEEPAAAIKRLGLVQVSDEASLAPIIDKILESNPRQVADYRAGKEKIFGFFVGQVMKETKGQANPQMVNDLLIKKLKADQPQ
ncbi:MAG TPA: Asp-tRNA(Asn)/Glu-tRNA(Gln) amidotransferase subunit GatB [Acidobacteriota bacterium]|nr:Asp-tRNA(Asn)/Glu-tRNA(Gln) amidotransferase subunit GatB [Acidobacteriota bacterium]